MYVCDYFYNYNYIPLLCRFKIKSISFDHLLNVNFSVIVLKSKIPTDLIYLLAFGMYH